MDTISFILCLARSASFLALEVFCANSVIWHYDWSALEKHTHIAFMALYFCFSIVSLVFNKACKKMHSKSNTIVSIVEGIISALIIFALLIFINAGTRMTMNAWLTLFIQIIILLINIVSFGLQRKGSVE